MEATGAHNSSGQLNTVVDDGVMGDNISSEQVNSVVDVKGGTSSRERECFNRSQDDHFTRDRRWPAGGRRSLVTVEKLDISRSTVIRSSLRIPIRGKDKH